MNQKARPAWGKYDDKGGERNFHRLEHHCADVAACFELLLREPVLRSRFERALGRALDPVTEQRLAVIAFLHDLGKLNTGFQFKMPDEPLPGKPPAMGHLGEACLMFRVSEMDEKMGLTEMLESWGEQGFESLLLASLAHHGRPLDIEKVGNRSAKIWCPFGGYDPRASGALLRERIQAWFPEAFKEGPALPDRPQLGHFFAGIVALADQVGSDEKYFPFEPEDDPAYMERARKQAEKALRAKGLLRADTRSQSRAADFQAMFGHPTPRPLQRTVMEAPLDHPLLILESETGSGKTEAAVMRFAALWKAGLVDGLYFALPTRAAAVQIHQRIDQALKKFFPDEAPAIETVRAIPGYPFAGTHGGTYNPENRFEVFWEDKPDEKEQAARWSAESARHFLSSTAAVGTIDQVLLAGLQVKWAHLRGASLARSLLVVDEVHASDAYMTGVLYPLLWSHIELGGHALLMSATLGAVARKQFCQPGSLHFEDDPDPQEAERVPYPALTAVPPPSKDPKSKPSVFPIEELGRDKSVQMQVEPCLGDPAKIAELAHAAAAEGARVLVVRNTVTTAQDTFKALLARNAGELALSVNGISTLHHSRFAVEDRKRLDQAVEEVLGKERKPNQGGRVVIGTQTLEQSLDMDADLLITDLCPVDVLLQRIGRLHRHPETVRPAPFGAPRCIVLAPADESEFEGNKLARHGLGIPAKSSGIYRNLPAVRQTLQLAREHGVWKIPAMNRMLVERGTHPGILEALVGKLGGFWVEAEQKNEGRSSAEAGVADNHSLDRTRPIAETVFPGAEEQVRTRLGEEGPRIKLPEPVKGPFGEEVQVFNLPAHLCRSVTAEDIEQATAEQDGSDLVLFVGPHSFQYSPTGISRK